MNLFLKSPKLQRVHKSYHNCSLDVVANQIKNKVARPICYLSHAKHIKIVPDLVLPLKDRILNGNSRALSQTEYDPHEVYHLLHVPDTLHHDQLSLLLGHLSHDRLHLRLV